MVGFAGNEIELMEKQSDGSTLRDHLTLLWKQRNHDPQQMPEQLVPVDCPHCVMYLWEYWLEMSRRRTSNGFGVNPLSNQEVLAWARRKGVTLLQFEHKMLDSLEIVFLTIKNREKPPT